MNAPLFLTYFQFNFYFLYEPIFGWYIESILINWTCVKCQLLKIQKVQFGGCMLEFLVNFHDHRPKYIQLYDYIKREISNGNMSPGAQLPSSRKLANHLAVSRNMIVSSYDLLLSEGYIESKNKRGYFISNEIDTDFMACSEVINRSKTHTGIQEPDIVSESQKAYKIDFKYGQIDSKNFPYTEWRRALSRWLTPENLESISYGEKQGEISLRIIISDYIHKARGVSCSPDQIVLTSGTQMSLDYISRLINHKFKSVAVEDPGYVGARPAFQLNGLSVQPIKLKNDGIDLISLSKSESRVALIAPSHQFPMGMTMPISKRIELLKWAEENDGIIIENDYEGEFSHSGKPIPCLQSFDKRDRVIYLYTFSGSLLPAARMSFFVLPQTLVERYNRLLGSLEQTVPVYQQKALESFIVEGSWEKHIRRMRKLYKGKYMILKDSLEESMGDRIKIVGNEIGLHVLLSVDNGMKEKTLVEKAAEVGVKVYSTSNFWMDHQDPNLPFILLGFGNLSEEEIALGAQLLRTAWFE